MCGFGGFLDPNCLPTDQLKAIAGKMADALARRGPDGSGVWIDEGCKVAFVHRRLSILDLSPAGNQPMLSSTTRYSITYNGEIYNHLELRERLASDGYQIEWRGHSDTETLLACIEYWGIECALQRAVGMFGFALWDRQEKALTLARDRLGEKPVYYGEQNGVFLFGSDLNALRQHPAFCGEVDRKVLPLFLRHSYIPTPYSIYRNVHKLEPGCVVRIWHDGRVFNERRTRYWTLDPNRFEQNIAVNALNFKTAADALEQALTTSVERQLLSDVPVGAFLSGGVDSSAVVAIMQKVSTAPVKSFSVGFEDPSYNEAGFAAAVAAHLGTDHYELIVTPQQALDVIPSLSSVYSEPFADSSQVPTFLVSQLASEHVKVSLSGDGADELFGGYNRYLSAWKTWRNLTRFPKPLRAALRSILLANSPQGWDKLYGKVRPLLPSGADYGYPGDKAHKLARTLTLNSPDEFFLEVTSLHQDPESLLVNPNSYPSVILDRQNWHKLSRFERLMMAVDTTTYLPDDILVKVDRATMACGLEARAPFLDHHLVEFANTMPFDFMIRSGQGKYLLRDVLYRYVPQTLIERPKMGFGIPIGDWLRSTLRPWAEELLSEKRLSEEGYFNCEAVQQLWQAHLSKKTNHQHILWNILMFQAWLDQYASRNL